MVLLGPAVFMPRVPATGGSSMTGFSATSWSQRRGIEDFGLWWWWLERMGGLSASYWNGSKSCCQLLGQACRVSWKSAVEGTGVSEAREEISAGSWSRTATCNSCTLVPLHLLLEQVKCLYLTQNDVWWDLCASFSSKLQDWWASG